jgi:uncharacterized membrane protein SpoIIM required for sporulation
VALLCFSLGFMVGVPTVVLLIENGLILGAMTALHFDKGLGPEFVAWLSIHGVTELSAIVLSAAAGLAVAQAIVMPGRGTRLENLATGGRQAATVMVGAVLMLSVAAVLEGVFRQLISSTPLRFLAALASLVLWVLYFLRGREGGDG